MSIGSVPKRFRCIILSASVISPSMVYKSAVDCIEMLTKLYPKITYSSMVKNMKKWSGIHTRATKSSSLPKGHPLSMSTKFGRRPFPHSSVILFTEGQNDRTISCCGCIMLPSLANKRIHNLCLRLVGEGNNNDICAVSDCSMHLMI